MGVDGSGRLPSVPNIRRMLIDRAAGELPDDPGAVVWPDAVGPAVYRWGGKGTPCTLVACFRCLHISIIPTLPARPVIFWTCPSGHTVRLEPPLSALLASLSPAG